MISYRHLTTAGELTPCIRLQAETWRSDDLEDVVPVHLLLTAAKYGGVAVGAFDGDEMIGFAFGFVGLSGGRPLLCSHMLAVLPAYRGKGIGVTLKLEQRRLSLETGLDLMHWTYDPLEAVNGRLNIGRLGGIARTYHPNLYGEMHDGLNAGIPSDRLVVEWHLAGRRAAAAAEGRPVPTPATLSEAVPLNGPDTLPEADLLPDASAVALYPPRSFQQLKREDPDMALQWRLATRHAFQAAFGAGFILTGFDQGAYILTRGEELQL